MNNSFWNNLDKLVVESKIIIDRPKFSSHPRYPQIKYPLDYGYVEGTKSGDGHEIDVWIGANSDRNVSAIACTFDKLKKDSEIKILLGFTEDDIEIVSNFYNSEYMSAIILRRNSFSK
jgi:inorganic pyrophosphatase